MKMQQPLISALNRLQKAADKAMSAILEENLEVARVHIDQIRILSSHLGFNFKKNYDDLKRKEEKIVPGILNNVKATAEKLELIEAWCHRNDDVTNFWDLVETEDGRNYIIDTFLPFSWNYDRDLVFLFSKFSEKIASTLKKRGQINIIIFSEKSTDTKTIKYVKTRDEVTKAILSLETLPVLAFALEPLDVTEKKEEVKEIHKEIDEILKRLRITQKTIANFSKKWFDQKIFNTNSILNCHHLYEIKKFIEGRPVIIVSPGPSIGKDIKKLKEYSAHCVIIAVGQSCPILAKYEISPDFVLVVDAEPHVEVLDGLPEEHLKALILYETVHSDFYDALPNTPIVSVGTNAAAFFDLENQLPEDIRGGSVSVVALKIAILFNASIIGLMGNDLHLSKGNYLEIEDTPNLSNPSVPNGYVYYQNSIQKAIILETNSKKEVKSFSSYWSYLLEIEEAIRNIDQKRIVVNFSLDGVKIEGAKYKNFNDFCEEYIPNIIGKNEILHDVNIMDYQRKKDKVILQKESIQEILKLFKVCITRLVREYVKNGFNEASNSLQEELNFLYSRYVFMNIYSQEHLQYFQALSLSKSGDKLFKSEVLNFYKKLQNDIFDLEQLFKKLKL